MKHASRRTFLAGVAALMATTSVASATISDQYYYIGGVNFGVLSDTQIVIEPFSAWLWEGKSGWGGRIVGFQNQVVVDMTKVGLNGRDAGSPGTPPDGAYKFWMLCNDTTGEVGFVATLTLDIRNVVFPAGFTLNRKMPYGQSVISGRCLPSHAANWPMPTVTFTERLVVKTINGPTSGWMPIDLSNYIPENARLGYFQAELSAPANMWISPLGTTGQNYWKTVAKGDMGGPVVPCRVNGNQVVYVWLDAGVTALLILVGFSITEVS